MSVAVVGCFDPADDNGDGGGTGSASLSATGITTADDGSGTSGGSASTLGGTSAGDEAHGDTGVLFDVGNLEESGGSDTGVGPVGPGSCRLSEVYGAAGGYPQCHRIFVKISRPLSPVSLERGVLILHLL